MTTPHKTQRAKLKYKRSITSNLAFPHIFYPHINDKNELNMIRDCRKTRWSCIIVTVSKPIMRVPTILMVALCQLLIGAMSQDSPCDCDDLEKDIVELQKANDDIRMNLNILTSVMNIRRIQQVSGFECSRVLRSKSIRFRSCNQRGPCFRSR